MRPKHICPRLVFATALILSFSAHAHAQAQSDLFVRITTSDTGVEPYTGPGPIWLSPDIWVRNSPDPNFDPYPFPTANPAWTPAPHQNPEYRDSKTSQPNYVYVRIHNRGRTPSTGAERLKLYQAKASTGLGWPSSWVDNVQTACGESLLHGIEVTKPRLNAKDVSVTERVRYRDAVIAVASNPAFRYSDGMQYFTKQNVVHTSGPEHGNPAFLPWHREMVNRYEALLREADPLVTLLYWDFTENPTTGTSLFDANFMGQFSGTVTGPLASALPTTITRNVGGGTSNCSLAQFSGDPSLLSNGAYPGFRFQNENSPNHNCAHGYIGGYALSGNGPISSLSTAVRDPFFFLLHANVDRQWASWQRDGSDPTRIDTISAYGSDSSNSRINASMRPWDGTFSVPPWTGAGITVKNSKDRSVVYPPVYDTAPLNIPVLQPGESVVMEIPWYPPNVNSFNCAGDSGHFCLLARIETEDTAPFGMTTPETMSISSNTIANNNIAWKNVTIVDNVIEPQFLMISGTTIRNFFDREAFFAIRVLDRTEKRRFLLQEIADVGLILPDDILERAIRDERQVQDLENAKIEGVDRKVLRLAGKEPSFRIPMKPHEAFTVELLVRPRDEQVSRELLAEPFLFDIEQELDLPREMFDRDKNAIQIGGVRFEIDFARALKGRQEVGERDNERLTELDRLRDFQPVNMTIDLQVDRLRKFTDVAASQEASRHLSPGEPLNVVIGNDDPQVRTQRVTLEVDDERRQTREGLTLRETITFDQPGVHTIIARGVDSEGRIEQRRIRVLVSENIPPLTAIVTPETGMNARVGEPIVVTAETVPAFERRISEVTLHVKSDDLFATGLDLVGDGFPPVDRSSGEGPHQMTFTPSQPGRYMLQVGARDDAGNLGVSGHLMVVVE